MNGRKMDREKFKKWVEDNLYESGGINGKKVSKKIWWKNSGILEQYNILYELTNFLNKNTKILERIRCIISNVKKQRKCYCKKDIIILERKYCSKPCHLNSKETKRKIKESYFAKTGYENPSQNPEIKQKKIDNYLKKTGYNHPGQNPKTKRKIKESYFAKTGYENPSQNPEILKKIQTIYFNRTGYSSPSQNPEIKQKKINTYLRKTGYNHPLQNPEVRHNIIESNIKKYGCKNIKQIHISKETLKKLNNPVWLKEQHHNLNKSLTQIAKELGDITDTTVGNYFHKHNIEIKTSPISQGEKDLKEFISSIYDGEIITNTRAVISPKELDIYLPDLNIAFEYNGEYWHKESSVEGMGVPLGYHRTKTSLCRTKGIKLYHIWERHWANNQEKMKQTIINIVREKK